MRQENFVTELPQVQNICGAFCLPAHRGKGLYPSLLNFLINVLASEGYTLLGVDYESFNPTAAGFAEALYPIYKRCGPEDCGKCPGMVKNGIKERFLFENPHLNAFCQIGRGIAGLRPYQ